jgi:twitching motility protein PilT
MDEHAPTPMTEELFHSLLALAVKRQASDIHLEVGYPPTLRVFGELLATRHPPLTHEDTEAIARLVLSSGGPGPIPEQVREIDRSYSLPGVSRFRASVFRQRGSWGTVMRAIPFAIPELDALDLPPVVRTVAGARRGLVLVTGATGNGKTTTVAALVNEIVRQDRLHVVTVEDPIEFLFPAGAGLVIQREVGADTASEADALRAALRQDPDVIVVSELRDRAAADICLKAAETGHLVIASLHTPDVVRSINRIVGLFPGDEQETIRGRLADNLQAVLSLRLLPRCDVPGVVPAVEALLATSGVREAIRDGGSRVHELRSYMEHAATAGLGMHTFDQELERLVRARRIAREAALAHATDRRDLERRLGAGGERSA